MAKGEFLAANLMLAMLPEEPLVEAAFHELSTYKMNLSMGIQSEPPLSAMMGLIMKWKNKGKTTEQIVSEINQVEEAKEHIDRRNLQNN